ncbi:LysM peptidoglycan-binding domain-containing protein [Tumebacillus flagellatus]|uniref:LysM domain-containing protein n=1 Tax=Tumebacillus flagellatus TaxID=1157490 RepID=A0A074LNR3_9BACL|nr:LysM peptidoglycan-binding domain-containing protein [Tumebacillus flagellatus]KEO82100.1 hypothetical protein EL26_17475 [Tumebacillus flagellatus]
MFIVDPQPSDLASARLRIGNFIFEQDDLPDEITMGGDQMLSVILFPGGFKEVQSFGVQDRNPAWSGVLNYEDALQKAQALEAMYRTGGVFEFKLEDQPSRLVVIKKFNWLYRSRLEVPYDIELELVTSPRSLLETDPVTAANISNFTQEFAYPQGTYTVVYGDTLWGLALRFYGNGELYTKIAEANNIPNPDWIDVGQKLVIP